MRKFYWTILFLGVTGLWSGGGRSAAAQSGNGGQHRVATTQGEGDATTDSLCRRAGKRCNTPQAGCESRQERLPIYDFTYFQRSNGWLTSSNAAGLHGAVPMRGISYAEAFFNKENGDWRNYSESNDSYDFGLRTESYRSFEKITFYGRMEYRYFRGENMSGSIFVNPGEHPFDLVEFTPGAKTMERYRLDGGAGFAITQHLNGGIRFDYEADNYAKRKDLRHKNTRMDFNLSAGLMARWGIADLGANYLYRKNTEKIACEQIGTAGENYYMFFNKGVWFGESGLWDGNGMHLSEPGISGLPLKNTEQGAALQVNLGRKAVRFFNEFTFRSQYDESGEKGTIWNFARAKHFQYRGILQIAQGENAHRIHGGVSYVNLWNYENILLKENISGVIQTVIYGHRLIYRQRTVTANVEYEYAWQAAQYNPWMTLRVGAAYADRSAVGSLVFPYTRSQTIENVRIYANWERNLALGADQLQVRVGLACATGGGNRLSEGKVTVETPDMELGDYATGNDLYRNYEFEYLTATREELSLGLRYTHPVGRIGLPVYVDAGWHWTHAQAVRWIEGQNRHALSLALGCMF